MLTEVCYPGLADVLQAAYQQLVCDNQNIAQEFHVINCCNDTHGRSYVQ